jgi:hypothetical protein
MCTYLFFCRVDTRLSLTWVWVTDGYILHVRSCKITYDGELMVEKKSWRKFYLFNYYIKKYYIIITSKYVRALQQKKELSNVTRKKNTILIFFLSRHPSWQRWLLQQPHCRRPQPLDTRHRYAAIAPLVRIIALHVPTMEREAWGVVRPVTSSRVGRRAWGHRRAQCPVARTVFSRESATVWPHRDLGAIFAVIVGGRDLVSRQLPPSDQ